MVQEMSPRFLAETRQRQRQPLSADPASTIRAGSGAWRFDPEQAALNWRLTRDEPSGSPLGDL